MCKSDSTSKTDYKAKISVQSLCDITNLLPFNLMQQKDCKIFFESFPSKLVLISPKKERKLFKNLAIIPLFYEKYEKTFF